MLPDILCIKSNVYIQYPHSTLQRAKNYFPLTRSPHYSSYFPTSVPPFSCVTYSCTLKMEAPDSTAPHHRTL